MKTCLTVLLSMFLVCVMLLGGMIVLVGGFTTGILAGAGVQARHDEDITGESMRPFYQDEEWCRKEQEEMRRHGYGLGTQHPSIPPHRPKSPGGTTATGESVPTRNPMAKPDDSGIGDAR